MAEKSESTSTPQEPYVVPECECGGRECIGPEPVPWLPWKHCFRIYEFRNGVVPLDRQGVAASHLERLVIRVQYEHALCLTGRKQGPIVHSLTLLPKEEVRLYEYDRYRRSTAVTDRFSVRTSFFTLTQRVQDAYSRVSMDAGASVSAASSVSAKGGGGIDLGIISIGGGASTSSSTSAAAYFDVASVSEQFSHVAHTSSLAVESERSIVVSTFEEQDSLQSTARTLRNDNDCRAVTYYVRRVFEVYELRTRIAAIEVQVGDRWVPLAAAPDQIEAIVKKYLANMGVSHDPKVEIALPTDGLLYEAETAHCCSCECEREARIRLDLERLQLENLNLRLEAERRQKRLDAGDLDSFEPPPPAPEQA